MGLPNVLIWAGRWKELLPNRGCVLAIFTGRFVSLIGVSLADVILEALVTLYDGAIERSVNENTT